MHKKILLIRNDKLGDFVLSLPSFAMLKRSLPNCQISALLPPYTATLAKICPDIDEIIIDQPENNRQTLQEIRTKNFDAAISLFSNRHNALLLYKAKIPYRLAPATKIIQFLYNHRLKQRRSQSIKPEYEYNLDLIRFFLKKHCKTIIEPQPPYLQFSAQEIKTQKQKLSEKLQLDIKRPWLFIHPGSGGSSHSLTLKQYSEIIKGLSQILPCQFILSAGPNEKQKTAELYKITGLSAKKVKIYDENDGLIDFARSLACANGIMAGSTGPLHLAAALNQITIGFFPSHHTASALRWQPINQAQHHLAFSAKNIGNREKEMQTIAPAVVIEKSTVFLKTLWKI